MNSGSSSRTPRHLARSLCWGTRVSCAPVGPHDERVDERASRRRFLRWIVETCVVIDVVEDDPQFGLSSAKLLRKSLPGGLTIAPVTFIELSAAFGGERSERKRFLEAVGISYSEAWTAADTEASHRAWDAYVRARRSDNIPQRPIAGILIGGFAQNRTGLITRTPSDCRRWFPKLSTKGANRAALAPLAGRTRRLCRRFSALERLWRAGGCVRSSAN